MLVKWVSQGIKILTTKKTSSFVWEFNEVRFQDIYLVNFANGDTLKLTALSNGENEDKHDCLAV